MKYKLVRIYPDGEGRKRTWKIRFESVDGDRENENTVPNPQGFYYYPATIPDNVAKDRLLSKMINVHEDEIIKLQDSMTALEKLRE